MSSPTTMSSIDADFIRFLSDTALHNNPPGIQLRRVENYTRGTNNVERFARLEIMILNTENSLETKAKMFSLAQIPVTNQKFLEELSHIATGNIYTQTLLEKYAKTEKAMPLDETVPVPKPSAGKRPASEVTDGPEQKRKMTSNDEICRGVFMKFYDGSSYSNDCNGMARSLTEASDVQSQYSDFNGTDVDSQKSGGMEFESDEEALDLEVVKFVSAPVVPMGRNPAFITFLQRLHLSFSVLKRHELNALCKRIQEVIKLASTSQTMLFAWEVSGILMNSVEELKGQRCYNSENCQFFIYTSGLVEILLDCVKDCPCLEYFHWKLVAKQAELSEGERLIVAYLDVSAVFSKFINLVADMLQ